MTIKHVKYKEIAVAIIAMQEADLKLRDQLIKKGLLRDGYNEEMQKLHESNAQQLDKIIDNRRTHTIKLCEIRFRESVKNPFTIY